MRPAQRGATALVPPMTMVLPSTRMCSRRWGRRRRQTSGTPRPPVGSAGAGTLALACQVGRGKTLLTPPPVAPPLLASSFQTISEVMVEPLPTEVGASAGEDVGAGGGEVDVVLAVSLPVGGAVVAGGYGDGDAESGGGLAGCVERVHGLVGPTGLGAAPADGDDAGFVGGVVDGSGDGVDEALVGVGGEVDDDLCAGRDGGGDFDVEHDLAVGAVGVGGCVLAAVYGDGGDGRDSLAEAFEVGGDVGGAVAAAELDDADGLVLPRWLLRGICRAGRPGQVCRRGWRRRGVWRSLCPVRCAPQVALLAEDAKVGLGLRTVVEAEDGFDVADELVGEIDAAFANAVGDAVEGLMDEGDAEGLLHGGNSAGELDGAVLGLGRVGLRS